MDLQIIYQPYSLGDEIGIVELLCSVFPKWSRLEDPIHNWIWKHIDGPYPSEVYVAKDGDKIVGVNHRIVLDIKIGKSVIKSGYGDEVAVHPNYQGQGIWKNLRIKADKKNTEHGIQFDYLATENQIVKENIVKMGYTPHSHSLSHLLKIINKEQFLIHRNRDDFITRIGVTGLNMLSDLRKNLYESAHQVKVLITDLPRFDDRVNVFWEKVKDSLDYCIVKDSTYLNWKYDRPSIHEKRIQVAISNGEILGFIILGVVENENYREGIIVDLLALPERNDVVQTLLDKALIYFNSLNVAAVIYQATKGHPYEKLVKQRGFFDASSQNTTYFYFRIIDKKIPTDILNKLIPSRVQLNYF